MKFIRNVKKYRRVIGDIVCYIIAIALFIGAYIYADTYITKKINDQQYESCKKIIYSIYVKGENNIIDIPSDMYFNESLMRVGVNNRFGYAQAIIRNEKLIVGRNYETAMVVFINLVVAAVAAFIVFILKWCGKYFYKQFEKDRSRIRE